MTEAKILIADNDPDFLETRREFLERKEYAVVTASSPIEARKKLEEENPDLAILDIRLVCDDDERDASGVELAKEIGHSVPVLLLTGYPSLEYARQVLKPQLDGFPAAYDFIVKQDGPEAMLTAVRNTLEVAETRQRVIMQYSQEAEKVSWQQWKPFAALITWLLALGTGVWAMVLGDRNWLFGTVAFAILSVVLLRLRETRESHLSPRQKPAGKHDPVTLDVPEQMRQDYEMARQHARWIGAARIWLMVGGALIFLAGVVAVILGYRDVGVVGAIGGLIAGTLGRLMTQTAQDANRRWDQFHQELMVLHKKQPKGERNRGR